MSMQRNSIDFVACTTHYIIYLQCWALYTRSTNRQDIEHKSMWRARLLSLVYILCVCVVYFQNRTNTKLIHTIKCIHIYWYVRRSLVHAAHQHILYLLRKHTAHRAIEHTTHAYTLQNMFAVCTYHQWLTLCLWYNTSIWSNATKKTLI